MENKELKDFTTKEILDAIKNSDEALLKSKKMFKKANAVINISAIVASFGLGVFAFAEQPIVKLTSLLCSLVPTTVSLWFMSSKYYRTVEAEYKVSQKISDDLRRELFKRYRDTVVGEDNDVGEDNEK